MLFNSYEFILLFLPVSVAVFYGLGSTGRPRAACLWLVIASLFFYGWWKPAYLLLLVFSIGFNYGVGLALGRMGGPATRRRVVLALGIAVNLGLLGYFKYANFFVANWNELVGSHWSLAAIVLPLAISFFTFNQIAYLVDAYRGIAREYDLVSYSLFISFFPHLIAGPIVHHKEMIPQFQERDGRFNAEDLAVGLTIFCIGLTKKVLLADGIAPYANQAFDIAAHGGSLHFADAWMGALAYTLQLYFDFSGYSDMAIGAARLFGIRFPNNFDSPYKATNIIDFWRRWHITLSNFLRDYLYIPLGGNRKGPLRRYVNLLATMLLGGLWHGAGWTFVIWGGLHGFYLVINHAWRTFRKALGHDLGRVSPLGTLAGRLATFLAVVVAWVFFRSENLPAALKMLALMAGTEGISLPNYLPTQLIALLLLCWFAPNTQQWIAAYRPVLEAVSSPARWQ